MGLLKKVLGTLYGTAIGDALGMPTTFMTRETIKQRYGFVDKFIEPPSDSFPHSSLKAGTYTDDTGLTFALARSIIREKRVNPEAVAAELMKWVQENDALEGTIIGPSTRKAIENMLNGMPIELTGRSGTTNGCAMKISVVGIFDSSRNYDRLLDDVIKACMPTHYTGTAISGAMAVATAVKLGINGNMNPIEISHEAIKMAELAGKLIDGNSISDRIHEALSITGSDDQQYLDNLYDFLKEPNGALTEDAVPAAISIFVRSNGEFKRAALLACNLGGDADTIGAITGAIAGSFKGISNIPEEWIMTIDQINRQNDIRKLAQDLINAIQI